MIIKQLTSTLVIVLFLVSCHKVKGPEKPKNLISKAKMVNILIDAKLLSNAGSVNKRFMKNSGVDIDTYIFEKHNIDSLQFALSNAYYAFRLDDYEDIYNTVEDSLNALVNKFKDLEAKEWKENTKKEEDSIKALPKDKIVNATSKIDSLKRNKRSGSQSKILKKKQIDKRNVLIEPISDKDFQQ